MADVSRAGRVLEEVFVAVVALTEPDDLWSADQRADPQTYIGRLLVAGGEHGKGYGAAVVEAVANKAQQRGDRWLLEHEHAPARLLRRPWLQARPNSRRTGPYERRAVRA